MGRIKNKKSSAANNGAEFIVVLGIVLLVLFLSTIPIVLLLLIPYYIWLRYTIRTKLKEKPSISSYWLSEDEKVLYKSSQNKVHVSTDNINEIKTKIERIHQYARDNNVKKNVDGAYSRRSDVGKEVVNALDDLSKQLNQEKYNFLNAKNQLTSLCDKPLMEWTRDKQFLQKKDKLSRRIKVILQSFVFALILFFITQIDDVNVFLINLLGTEGEIIFWISLLSLGFGLLTDYHQMKLNKAFKPSADEPPVVTLENLDTYHRNH